MLFSNETFSLAKGDLKQNVNQDDVIDLDGDATLDADGLPNDKINLTQLNFPQSQQRGCINEVKPPKSDSMKLTALPSRLVFQRCSDTCACIMEIESDQYETIPKTIMPPSQKLQSPKLQRG